METFSTLLALCEGNPPVTGGFPSQKQWCGALMFSLICAWANVWANNRDAGDLKCHRGHYNVNVMIYLIRYRCPSHWYSGRCKECTISSAIFYPPSHPTLKFVGNMAAFCPCPIVGNYQEPTDLSVDAFDIFLSGLKYIPDSLPPNKKFVGDFRHELWPILFPVPPKS